MRQEQPSLVPKAPLGGPARIAWLASLSESIALDAIATAGTVAEEFDLSPAEVAPILDGMADYLCGRVRDAVQLGGDLWEQLAR